MTRRHTTNTIDCDFLVIGSGIAGLTFALKAAEHGDTLVATKAALYDTNTRWAQGGVAAAVGADDSWRLHEQDTLEAGAGLCNPEAVRFLVQNAIPRLEWLIELGARFDWTEGAELPQLQLGREGGHSRNRIVHAADQTGWEIERTLIDALPSRERIKVLDFTFCEALLTDDAGCAGAILRPRGQDPIRVRARATCLATGSCCRVYRFTTNPPIATGDGIALAASVGAKIENMEFIQFHPTTLYHRSKRGFLISEAVRGAGGILRTIHGRRFMFDYDPRGELAPRDIVARAIHSEILKEGVPFVHLDTTHLAPEEIKTKFPNIYRTLLELGVDMTRDPIPVVPAAHYQCGGVNTDLYAQTTMPGLYAAGEVANTGVHGANRLASNSLLEALVFGYAGAEHAAQTDRERRDGTPNPPLIPPVAELGREGILRRLRHVMWERVGIVRRTRGLQIAQETVQELIEEALPSEEFSVSAAEAADLLLCGKIIVEQALARKENVGLHYNEDLAPKADKKPASVDSEPASDSLPDEAGA
ncbi:MAG: L-aspartate oxidase [Armatimonadetes bacterium]|nr:MAG: L-aspartate oxidase [Armatimonadota bacterium]